MVNLREIGDMDVEKEQAMEARRIERIKERDSRRAFSGTRALYSEVLGEIINLGIKEIFCIQKGPRGGFNIEFLTAEDRDTYMRGQDD